MLPLAGDLQQLQSQPHALKRSQHPTVAHAGGGIEQAELAQLAGSLFSGVAGGKTREPPSKYTGGDFRTAATSGESDALLAFEVRLCNCLTLWAQPRALL